MQLFNKHCVCKIVSVVGSVARQEPPLLLGHCLANQVEELLATPYSIYCLLLHRLEKKICTVSV
jgi:hypothetical protein